MNIILTSLSSYLSFRSARGVSKHKIRSAAGKKFGCQTYESCESNIAVTAGKLGYVSTSS
jgi:hypothetical protein